MRSTVFPVQQWAMAIAPPMAFRLLASGSRHKIYCVRPKWDDIVPLLKETWRQKSSSSQLQATTESRGADRAAKVWQRHFENLKAFLEEDSNQKHSKPWPYPSDPKLQHWLDQQRFQYQRMLEGLRTTITSDRKEKLESLGLSLNPLHDRWEHRYEQLNEFLQTRQRFPKRNHSDPEESELFWWCQKQKLHYRIRKKGGVSSLTEDRLEKLEAICFVWNEHDAVWMANYQELCRYATTHSDCLVPTNTGLGRWVTEVRHQYKRLKEGKGNNLTRQKIELLEAIGFVFSARQAKWLSTYHVLEEHVRMNGPGTFPNAKQDPSLYSWVQRQKNEHRMKQLGVNTPLTDEREKLLKNLGIV